MQDSESIAKAIKAIEAQVKAIAEELQVDGSAALQVLEDTCGGADAVVRWALSASEEQGTGCKCGEGACKAKEEAQAPAPVSKPAAPEAAPEATDLIETTESVWSEGTNEICLWPIWVGPKNRVTIPLHIIELAEEINGTLKPKRRKSGALTVIKGDDKVTVLFGDKSAKHEGASVVRLNRKGQAQICVSPAFTDGDAVKFLLLKDGGIAITQLSEDELFDLI